MQLPREFQNSPRNPKCVLKRHRTPCLNRAPKFAEAGEPGKEETVAGPSADGACELLAKISVQQERAAGQFHILVVVNFTFWPTASLFGVSAQKLILTMKLAYVSLYPPHWSLSTSLLSAACAKSHPLI